MRRMRLEQSVLGYILAEPALDGDDRPLAPRGAEVTQEILDRLLEKGVQYVFVEDDAFDGLNVTISVSPQTMRMASAIFHDVQSQFAQGKPRSLQYPLFARLARRIEKDVEDTRIERAAVLQPVNERQRDLVHALNRTALAIYLADELRLHRYRMEIAIAALIADIGMWTLPHEILEKRTPLTAEERQRVEEHVAASIALLSPNDGWSAITKAAVQQHHERMDGSGYPRHLRGPDIHVSGRLLAICDVFSAICLVRPGRRQFTPAEAIEHLMGGAETMFDFDLVQAFYRLVPPFPVGTEVVLSTGEHAVVLEVPDSLKARPRVRIFTDPDGRRRHPFEEIDLSDRQRQALTIVGVV